MARVIFSSDETLAEYSPWDASFSTALLTRQLDYEEDFPEIDYTDSDYYEGYGEYVAPEMDCN